MTHHKKLIISDKIKALSALPSSHSTADYKDEPEEILAEKFGGSDSPLRDSTSIHERLEGVISVTPPTAA